MIEAALLVGGYLVGSIPFGVLVARARGVNLFEVGSGNVGATNVKRALGPGPALLVFLLDVAKGAGPAAVAWWILDSREWALGVGLVAIVGHCLSPFLGFRGGKGVATGLGAMLGSSPAVALSAFGVFLFLFGLSRIVSLSSLFAVSSLMLFGWLYGDSVILQGFYVLLAAFVFYRHRGNIARLAEGTEPRFSFRREKDDSDSKAPSDPKPQSFAGSRGA
jgi:acyl phosphate:glycerol-3-phosphate acyltransferase